MKIMFLSHTGAVTGGAEQCLLEYVDVLRSMSHRCKVIVPYKGPMTHALTDRGIDNVVVGYGWATWPHRRVHRDRIAASTGNSLVRIFQEIEKYKPDIIVSNTSVIPWGLYAGKAFSIPAVLLVHEILNEKDPSLRIAPNYDQYHAILNQYSDFVIYNSYFVRDEFKNTLTKPATSTEVLYPLPPLDSQKIQSLYRENVIEKKLRMAVFGAISPRKNQYEALQAVKLLADKGITNVTLDLYGDINANSSYTKKLRKFIKDNSLGSRVKIKGFATNVYEVMNEYNVILSTATFEPFGRTIIEGQLFGRVVIANQTGGGAEIVDDKKNGLIYHSGKPDELAGKIEWVIRNHKEALKLGEFAKYSQYEKFLTSDRYKPLAEAVEYCAGLRDEKVNDIFDPMYAMFQHNHQLNNRYRHLYRLTHNRITYPMRDVVVKTKSKLKQTIRKVI